jgi:hypothetical protein
MAYEDLLKDTSESKDDGNYFLVTITDLDLSTQYPIQFRWKNKNGTLGSWSSAKYFITDGATVPSEPNLGAGDVVGGAGFIKVTWNGNNALSSAASNFDRVNIHISGSTFGDGTKPAGFFKQAGTQTFTAAAGVYIVQLKIIAVDGTESFFSTARTITVTEVVEEIQTPVAPTGFSSSRILSGLEVAWDGTYGTAWTGFEAINIYAGTSSTTTNGTYIKVGQMTANKITNKIVIPVDGTYVRYNLPVYIHASSVNKNGVESTISANVTSQSSGARSAIGTDLADEIITSAKLVADSVTATKIALGAITEVKIDTNAVTAAKIAAGAVTETKISDNAISSPKIVAGAIEAGKIAAGAITADKIAANAIESDKIAANAITSDKILANAITAGKIDALAITSDKIAANAITATKILAGEIDVTKLSAGTISVNNLESGTLSATSFIRAGTAGSSRIEISSAAVPASSILAGLYIYNSAGTAVLSAPLGGGITIVGNGTFTGDISGASGTLTNALNVGTISEGLYPFSVSSSGVMRAISGTIGGLTLAADAIQNTGNTFRLDSTGRARFGTSSGNALILNPSPSSGGYYIYHSSNGGTAASGKFSVSDGGILTATGASFSGTITNSTSSDFWNNDGTFRFGGTNGISYSSGLITMGSAVSIPSAQITGTIQAGTFSLNANNYWNSSGFRVGDSTNKLEFVSSTGALTVTGAIARDANNYWNSTGFKIGDGTNKLEFVSSTGALTVTGQIARGVHNYWNDSGFKVGNTTNNLEFVSSTGALTVTGSVNASGGAIAGWSISPTQISKGSTILDSSSTNGFIQIGSGSSFFKASSDGIQLGDATFGSAPFRVTPAGVLTATGATISGAITATSGSFTGSLTSTSGTVGGFTLSPTSIFSGTDLVIENTGQITGGNSSTLFYGFVNIGGGAATGHRLIVAGTSALNGNTGVLGNLSVTNSATFGAVTQQFEFLSSTGNVRVASTYGNSVSGRSMQISSAGLYGTTASTLRKKHDIESYKINSSALLGLDVKTFKYKPEIDPDQTIQYGFIAEDAEALGLDELIQYDSTGIPDYFAYEKLPIFLLQLIQEQDASIKSLKLRLDALEG